jgi:3',5'-nucleoside bisphosphate phosphatase
LKFIEGISNMAMIDLHMHSNYSTDGEFSPAQLVDLCLEARLTHAAIADHNSVRAVAEALSAADGTCLTVIPAIELDCEFKGINLHLLGYGIDHTAPVFSQIEEDTLQKAQDNSALLMHLVRQLGIDFEEAVVADLAHEGVVTGEILAEAALMYDREGNNPLLDPYRGNGDRSDNPYVNFYWDYCAQGKPAYTRMNFISLAHAIEVVHSYHGVPVLAHPGLNVKEDPQLLAEMIAAGVKGVEVYTSYHSPAQVAFYRGAAHAQRLLVTCGSDFHGKTKKSIRIGGVDCEGQEDDIITRLTYQISLA